MLQGGGGLIVSALIYGFPTVTGSVEPTRAKSGHFHGGARIQADKLHPCLIVKTLMAPRKISPAKLRDKEALHNTGLLPVYIGPGRDSWALGPTHAGAQMEFLSVLLCSVFDLNVGISTASLVVIELSSGRCCMLIVFRRGLS